ncbi:hypothetical protein O3G_MSEX005994 [Manduca sexta]|uniref:Retrotransposon gag domain-containing protein n=1 Tax=Manduca sexta TaxID=7130 RepID=A0A922CKE1_MANSE|nr:hypothetical protein O3G_MSEX005994 [Manduca sexta]
MHLKANQQDEEMKLPSGTILMDEETYQLWLTLKNSARPSTQQIERTARLLQNYLRPKPSMANRYIFRKRKQLHGESIADYLAELERLARRCNFIALEDQLCDQFVYGIKNESTRQCLLAEQNLNYTKAVSMAIALEAEELSDGDDEPPM